jgi:hypothetical protein
MISRSAGAAAALALITAAGTAGPALAARAAGSAAAAPATASPAAIYPGNPLAPAGAVGRREVAAAGAQSAPEAQATVSSGNWSGYAVSRDHVAYRYVRATFFVPFLNCPQSLGHPETYSSHWAGLDGFSSSTVEQDGIEADCVGATPSYHAWYEMYPMAESRVGLAIRGGDSITATVSYSGSSRKFTLEVADNTTGRHFSTAQKCKASRCARNSAEVVSESPATYDKNGNLVYLPLADYGAASFASIAIAETAGGTGGLHSSHWNTTKIVQVDSANQLAARPTAIQADTFDNYWYRER